jgi:integrase/recombinase XerD
VVAASALRVAVDRYLRHVTIERGLSDNTLAAYRRDLDNYLQFLGETGQASGGISSAEISPAEISPGGVSSAGISPAGISSPEAITVADVSAFSQHLATRAEGALAAS